MTAQVTRIGSTQNGSLYVEVNFGGCINDFIFTNLPAGGYGPATDAFGRWLTGDADKHPVFIPVDIPGIVLRVIQNFQNEMTTKGYSGDMRDHSIKLGGPDPRGLQKLVAGLNIP